MDKKTQPTITQLAETINEIRIEAAENHDELLESLFAIYDFLRAEKQLKNLKEH